MKLNIKDFKIGKTKKYLKANSFFFFVNGINRNALEWLITEQGLKTIDFSYYKILNKTTIKTLNISIYTKIHYTIKGSTFFLKPQQTQPFLKQTIFDTFNSLFFELLIFKLNNKIYAIDSFKNTYSIHYKEAKLILYHFSLASTKTCYKFSK